MKLPSCNCTRQVDDSSTRRPDQRRRGRSIGSRRTARHGKDMVVVAHSQGGVCASTALEGLGRSRGGCWVALQCEKRSVYTSWTSKHSFSSQASAPSLKAGGNLRPLNGTARRSSDPTQRARSPLQGRRACSGRESGLARRAQQPQRQRRQNLIGDVARYAMHVCDLRARSGYAARDG